MGCGLLFAFNAARVRMKHSPLVWFVTSILSVPVVSYAQAIPPVPPVQRFGAPQEPSPLSVKTTGNYTLGPDGAITVRGSVVLHYLGFTLSADRLDGSFKSELVFTGNARIVGHGVDAAADAIRFRPSDLTYELDGARGLLEPSLFNGQVVQPIHILGGLLQGDEAGDTLGRKLTATTCEKQHAHYVINIGGAELVPHKKLVLRRVSIVFFGFKLITLPTITVPLDRKPIHRPRSNYLPEIGQNPVDGYFARFPFEYALGSSAAGLLRLDLTQNNGIGYRIEQEYLAGRQPNNSQYSSNPSAAGTGVYVSAYGYGNTPNGLPSLGSGLGPASGGLLAIQGYLSSGYGRNFTATLNHQQSIGGSNRISLNEQLQHNSGFIGTGSGGSYTQTTRLNLDHNDGEHGNTGSLSLSLNTNSAPGFTTSQFTGSLAQTFRTGHGTLSNQVSYSLNLSHTLSSSTLGNTTTYNRTAQLVSQLQIQHVSSDYQYTLSANGDTPIGPQTGGRFGGGLEKLPELLVDTDTLTYKGGWLHKIPTQFQFGFGRYSEPGSNVNTDRILLGMNIEPFRVMKGRTEIVTGGGIEQRLYGDGAAQYLVHDETRLRQHLLGRSGIDIDYQYSQPEGATPFLFDQLRKSHYITAQAGYLEDRHFQLTAGVGYDLSGASQGNPWQTLTTRLMWHPVRDFRFDSTQTFDPNTGKFYSINNLLRFRGPNDMALDLLTNIDPQEPGIRRKFTQINTQFTLPISHEWRVLGLFRYSGLTNTFDSENLQLVRTWDCLTASLTYSRTSGGFRPDQSIFFTITLNAFPFSRAFAGGPFGQSVGTGIGSVY